MKTKEKILSIIMAVMLAASFAACNDRSDSGAASESDSSVVSTVSKSDPETDSEKSSDSDSKSKTESDKKNESKKTDSKKTDSKTASSKKTTSSKKSSASSKTTSSKKTSASSKTTSSKKSSSSSKASSDGQNPVMNFIGTYSADRAAISISAKGKDSADIIVKWAGSANSYSAWGMSGKFDSDSLTIEYSDCQKTDIELDSAGLIVTEDRQYTNGTGRIIFNEDGSLTWDDDEEAIADGMLFMFTNNSEAAFDFSESNDGYIEKSEALAAVKQQAGSGAQILDSYQGYSPEGLKAWVITVAPISASTEPEEVTYYVGSGFCYSDTNYSNDDEYLSREEAVANVKQQAGSGAQILDAYQGYSPDGDEAWVVTVAPITTGDDDSTVVYYVGKRFCYSE